MSTPGTSNGKAAAPPRVKICGVTTVDDALLAVDLGAEFLGFNFYPPSPRYIDPETACQLAEAVRNRAPGTQLVGVFVNASPGEVRSIADTVGLDLLQFHGDETPEDINPFADRALKVFRVRDHFDETVLHEWQHVWGFLVDSRHPRLYGGSGESWDFSSLGQAAAEGLKIFIAGGLGPHNVRQAVDTARPWGVDLCSGVEAEPGVKDPHRMQQLFEEIHHGQGRSTSR